MFLFSEKSKMNKTNILDYNTRTKVVLHGTDREEVLVNFQDSKKSFRVLTYRGLSEAKIQAEFLQKFGFNVLLLIDIHMAEPTVIRDIVQ